ncbi:MAG TPA: hypothetical protein VK031_06465 [Tissierellaceae bacterium]|nr:hypothetical protein [Tissierellaceae bacterium]
MKRLLIIISILAVIAIGSAFVYADSPDRNRFFLTKDSTGEWQGWHKERMDEHRHRLNRAVDEGNITKEEAEAWEEHFDYMEDFHKENGFMRGRWGCHGRGGHGMMRRYKRGW